MSRFNIGDNVYFLEVNVLDNQIKINKGKVILIHAFNYLIQDESKTLDYKTIPKVHVHDTEENALTYLQGLVSAFSENVKQKLQRCEIEKRKKIAKYKQGQSIMHPMLWLTSATIAIKYDTIVSVTDESALETSNGFAYTTNKFVSMPEENICTTKEEVIAFIERSLENFKQEEGDIT